MSKQTINIGTKADDGTGDTLRTAFNKTNQNFTEVFTLAQNAYNVANTGDPSGFVIDSWAREKANSASSNTITLQSVNDTQNTDITNTSILAQSAFDAANTNLNSIVVIEGVDLDQNTRMSLIEGVDLDQNTRMSIIEGVDVTQNTDITSTSILAQSAFDAANNAQGFRNTTLINTTPYSASNTEEILLCDPNAAGENIIISLSDSVNNGKIFTIKNINPGGYSVNVGATTIEDPTTKSFVSEVIIANTGEVYTWVSHSGVYRHIG